MKSGNLVEIMDTTLRDGEQIQYGSFSPDWKLRIAKALFEAGVDRVEVASARGFSAKEHEMLRNVMQWAESRGLEEKIEVLTFVDGKKSVEWVKSASGRTINLLCKGSEAHCLGQLKKSPKEHLGDIAATVDFALKEGLKVNIYFEDWSQGMKNSPGYVEFLIGEIAKLPVGRIMLCDTLGALNFWKVAEYVRQVASWETGIQLDFHGHNDYGLAVANALAAVKSGAKGIHVTVNGLGERAGNAPLDEVTVGIKDHLAGFSTNVNEAYLRPLSRKVAFMSGRRVPVNKPVSGESVFLNTAGVHADGDRKAKLYEHPKLKAERFGARIRHPLGKLSGRANVLLNLERLGWKLEDETVDAVLARVVKLADEGKSVTIGDLPYIVASVLNRSEYVTFEVIEARIVSEKGRRAETWARIRYKESDYEIKSFGDGGFDAFMNALRRWAKKRNDIHLPKLLDYRSSIPPGGTSAALVEVIIDWQGTGKEGRFQTSGVDCDQVLAAIEAAASAVNLCNRNGG